MNYSASIEIPASRAKVFEWLRDSTRLRQWVPNLEEDELLHDAGGGGVGTRFRQVYVENGRRMEMEGEVVAFEQDRYLACDIHGKLFNLWVDYRLERANLGTRLTQTAKITFNNFVLRLIGRLMAGAMRKKSAEQATTQLEKLRELIEAEGR